ncbi:MAG: hypothetical protein QM692_06800 [Thermomicrobiales bacterium]
MHAQRLLTIAGAGALMLTTAIGGLSATAQDATPAAGAMAHPVHIHSGNCNELGDVVAPLTDLTTPEGDAVGQGRRASTASTSYTNVPLPLDAILAADHAINAHLSADQIEVYIACGEIGGVQAPDGSLTIGLRETDKSGFAGVAYLVPGADGASTDVTVFLADMSKRGGGGGGDAAAATPDDAMAGMDMSATPAP